MSSPSTTLLVELVKAVARLALPADVQIAYLQRLGSEGLSDELALELHDTAVLIPQFVKLGWLSMSDEDQIMEMDARLEAMSIERKAELWTEDALRVADEWDDMRRLASRWLTNPIR